LPVRFGEREPVKSKSNKRRIMLLLLGFGNAWDQSFAIDETDRKALSVRGRPASVVLRAKLADGGVGCASRSAPD
jgi:hypothetical protein